MLSYFILIGWLEVWFEMFWILVPPWNCSFKIKICSMIFFHAKWDCTFLLHFWEMTTICHLAIGKWKDNNDFLKCQCGPTRNFKVFLYKKNPIRILEGAKNFKNKPLFLNVNNTFRYLIEPEFHQLTYT